MEADYHEGQLKLGTQFGIESSTRMNETEDLFALAGRAKEKARQVEELGVQKELDALEAAAKEFGKAWSGSWL